jgi:hypothetical protein
MVQKLFGAIAAPGVSKDVRCSVFPFCIRWAGQNDDLEHSPERKMADAAASQYGHSISDLWVVAVGARVVDIDALGKRTPEKAGPLDQVRGGVMWREKQLARA